jgi:uncharacterized protein (TIRG00374 family)
MADSQNKELISSEVTDTKDNEKDSDNNKNKLIEEENPQKNKKKKITTTIIFLIANALVILILILLEDKSGEMEPWANVKGFYSANWYYFALAFGMYLVMVSGDSFVFFNLTKRMGLKDNLGISIKTSILGRYYDRVTPWSIGGEPFQMAFLIRSGVKTSDSCAVTMSRHIIRFFCTSTAVIIILIASQISTNVWVMVAAIASVFGGLFVPLFMVICIIKPKIGQSIAKGIIGLLYKLKLVKDYDKQLKKVQLDVESFLKGIEYLSANKKMVIVIGLVALTELFANNSIPYFVMKGLGITVPYWNILVLCIFVNYASSFAPTPGGAGLAELSFYAIFAAHIGGGYLFWAVLTWRLAFFYAPIAIGFILQLIDGIFNVLKTKHV